MCFQKSENTCFCRHSDETVVSIPCENRNCANTVGDIKTFSYYCQNCKPDSTQIIYVKTGSSNPNEFCYPQNPDKKIYLCPNRVRRDGCEAGCEARCTQNYSLVRHLNQSCEITKGATWKCDECVELFNTLYDLNKHQKIHKIMCGSCKKVFTRTLGLDYHVKHKVCRNNERDNGGQQEEQDQDPTTNESQKPADPKPLRSTGIQSGRLKRVALSPSPSDPGDSAPETSFGRQPQPKQNQGGKPKDPRRKDPQSTNSRPIKKPKGQNPMDPEPMDPEWKIRRRLLYAPESNERG